MCAKHSSLTQTPPAVTCSHAPRSGDWRKHRASAFDFFSRCSLIEHASCLSKVPMVTWQVRLSEEVRGVHESTVTRVSLSFFNPPQKANDTTITAAVITSCVVCKVGHDGTFQNVETGTNRYLV